MSSAETKAQLMAATVRLTSREGIRAATARAIAAEAGVNQALVFYHFDGIEGLLRAAYADATTEMVQRYVAEFEHVSTFAELHAVGVRLGQRSRADGSAALLSHIIAASHTDEAVAQMLVTDLALWQTAVADAVRRVLANRGLSESLDIDAMSSAVAASSIGMIILDAVPGAPLGETMPSLSGVASIVDRAVRLVPAPLLRRLLGRVSSG